MEQKNYKFYEGQVLSIEQMKELESIGVDTSDASCMWTSIVDRDYNPVNWLPCYRGEDNVPLEVLKEKFPLTYKEGNIYYCYTLSDILKKLKRYTLYKRDEYWIEFIDDDNLIANTLKGESELECAYKMLKWCKENKYI